jgi:hypothetical protein
VRSHRNLKIDQEKVCSLSDMHAQTCQRVLGQENTNHRDVGRARPLRPPDTVDTGTINKCPEDKFAALVLRGRCEDGDDEGSSSNGMPPYRDVVEILEDVYAKGIDRAYVEVCWDSKI